MTQQPHLGKRWLSCTPMLIGVVHDGQVWEQPECQGGVRG